MGKTKKKNKLQRDIRQQFQNLNAEQLIRQGEQALEAGKARDAIGFFKSALKKECETDKIHPLLFRAYLMREEQLRRKNLLLEADAVKKQAIEYMPKFEQLSEDDFLAYLATCSDQEAFDNYEQYTAIHQKKSSKAEELLANRLFQNNHWELTDKLDESNPLRRDAVHIKKAVPFMNDGKWEDALEALQPVSRTSPFAAVRLFCRAMVSFYAEDDNDTFKALSMIPDNFPLNNVVKNLNNILSNPVSYQQKRESMSRLAPLWDGAVNIESRIKQLLHDLENRRFRQAKTFICEFADMVYPQNPTEARVFILQVLWTMILQGKVDNNEIENICIELLPPNDAELILLKTEILKFDKAFTSLGKYISALEAEFPDPETRNIARSFIIQDTAEKANEFKDRLNIMSDKKGIQTYGELLGIKSKSLEMILIEMAAESIRLDPYNREGYQLIARLPRSSKPAKKIAETALTDMARYFPEDPFPCLELAALYYETHAFRKAENILEDAMKRAPHDNRVIDRYVIGLMIAVDKNLKPGKFHLAEKDIERVSKLESKKTLPFIIGKRVLLHLMKTGNYQELKSVLEKETENLSVFERLRTVSIMILDIKSRKFEDKKSVLTGLEKILDNELKQIKSLSSPEIAKLLTPIEKDYGTILPSLNVAPIFLKKWKNILENIDNSEIIPLYDLILEPEFFSIIRKDIKERIEKAKDKDSKPVFNKDLILLEFYSVTMEHLSGKENDSELFENIIKKANGNVKEELRAASRKLSRHASGALRKALELFDFEILNDMVPFFYGDNEDDDLLPFPEDDIGGGFDKIMNMLDMLNPDSEDLEKGLMNDVISGFESFIDDIGVRGAPEFMIREIRKMIMADSKVKREFDMLAKLVERSKTLSKLSREAHIILFGKKKK